MQFFAVLCCPWSKVKEVAAHVAQLVEHILGKDEVSGSIPLMGSILNDEARANTYISRSDNRR